LMIDVIFEHQTIERLCTHLRSIQRTGTASRTDR
jgi:hypothetical protein